MWGAPSRATQCLGDNTLASFAEGRVAGDARRAVEEHLADCPECRAVLARLAGLRHVPAASSGAPWTEDAEVQPLVAGTPVGRYVIEAVIGHGAMGTVYAAHDPDLDRRVAVKLLRAESLSAAARQRMSARLLREAKAMARLSHPEVITVYDVGTFGDQLFVAMEHVEGCTLRRWRAAQHRSYAEIMAVYERAGSGLAAAHEAGLVHRDFKPDNVLIGRDGRVRVMDFGLARSDDSAETSPASPGSDERPDEKREVTTLTRTGTLLGTPAYMAPEQLRGNAATARSDVFSFCVSLYEALYGERPFAGTTLSELQSATERGQLRPLPIMTRVPSWMRANLLQGLRPSPQARFESMRALLDALRKDHARARQRLGKTAAAGAGGLGLLLVCAAIYTRATAVPVHPDASRGPSVTSLGPPVRASRANLAASDAPPPPPSIANLALSDAPLRETEVPHRSAEGPSAGGSESAGPLTAHDSIRLDRAASLTRSQTLATQVAARPQATTPEGARAAARTEGDAASVRAASMGANASSLPVPSGPLVGTNGALILE